MSIVKDFFDFKVNAQDGRVVSLKDYRGRMIFAFPTQTYMLAGKGVEKWSI